MSALYHYCSTSAFTSIIQHNSIWLSSLSLSNDTMEGRLVTKTFERLLSISKIDTEEIDLIRGALKFSEEMCDGLGFCLSEKPDTLSQWRGYANNAQGLSIGFSKDYLQELEKDSKNNGIGFELRKVLYEPSEHESALKPAYEKITELTKSGALKVPKFGLINLPTDEELEKIKDNYGNSVNQLYISAAKQFRNMFTLKSNAFSEEAEWRLVSYLFKVDDDKDDDNLTSSSYRAVDDRLIPYREVKLKPLSKKSILEVYIGPKNITPIHIFEKFLQTNGFFGVSIFRSTATYR